MAAAFAAIEARANAAIQKALANAVAIINDVEIGGIFNAPYQVQLGGVIESSQPTFTCLTADIEPYLLDTHLPRVTGLLQGIPLTIKGVDYVVTQLHPDGTGMTTVQLRAA